MNLTAKQQQKIINIVNSDLYEFLEKFPGFTIKEWILKNIIFSENSRTVLTINFKIENIETNEIKKFKKNIFARIK